MLIPNTGVGKGGRGYLTALRTVHFECIDLLGLVVDDSRVKSLASHLFMICKNWHVLISLYVM